MLENSAVQRTFGIVDKAVEIVENVEIKKQDHRAGTENQHKIRKFYEKKKDAEKENIHRYSIPKTV